MTTDLRPAILFCAILLCPACGSAPPLEADPAIEAEYAERDKNAAKDKARREQFEKILADMDRMLERYALALLDSGSSHSDGLAKTFEKHMTRVLEVHFPQFLAAALNHSYPRNRAIALAAIGISGQREALDPLLNGLDDANPEVVSNAAFGLALLKDPRTPPSYLARVIRNEELKYELRSGAAWSLLQIQTSVVDSKAFEPVWTSLLDMPIEETVPGIAVSALRGLGWAGNPEHNDLVLRYLVHPMPQVRSVAAVAVGRLGVQSSHTSLYPLIEPAESNPNVRLAGRKALQALAGGVDRGYDVNEWKRVFDRG